MIKNPQKLTWDLETSLCGELLPSPESDTESRPDIGESVAFEVAAWSWEREEEGVGEDMLATSSPVVASFSLDEPRTNWVESSFGAVALTRFCGGLLTISISPLYFQPSSIYIGNIILNPIFCQP